RKDDHRRSKKSRGVCPGQDQRSPLTRPNRYAGATVLQGAWVGFISRHRQTPPKISGCKAASFAPTRPQLMEPDLRRTGKVMLPWERRSGELSALPRRVGNAGAGCPKGRPGRAVPASTPCLFHYGELSIWVFIGART